MTAYRKLPATYGAIADSIPTTYRLATILHNRHNIVRYDP